MFFFFNDTATTEIYTLSLHDALPIFWSAGVCQPARITGCAAVLVLRRSEEHTSELQSRFDLVCRLLLEKKNHQRLVHYLDSVAYTHRLHLAIPALNDVHHVEPTLHPH